MSGGGFDDDDLPSEDKVLEFKDYDCPECNANNPLDGMPAVNSEIACHYCGQEYKVSAINKKGLVLKAF